MEKNSRDELSLPSVITGSWRARIIVAACLSPIFGISIWGFYHNYTISTLNVSDIICFIAIWIFFGGVYFYYCFSRIDCSAKGVKYSCCFIPLMDIDWENIKQVKIERHTFALVMKISYEKSLLNLPMVINIRDFTLEKMSAFAELLKRKSTNAKIDKVTESFAKGSDPFRLV